jgi:glutamyl-tRNA synthetase
MKYYSWLNNISFVFTFHVSPFTSHLSPLTFPLSLYLPHEQKSKGTFCPKPHRWFAFNYLFAKQHGGDFIVRIEDTDQTRFVAGAEEYIFDCLAWCGLTPDESPLHGGPHAPYRQSERKPMYKQYAEQLVKDGYAYYAFDTAEDLDVKRKEVSNFMYSQHTRLGMKNSLTLSSDEVQQLIADGVPHVVRIKMPADVEVKFTDMVRGEVSFNSSLVDDKVLLKADGMPTYHLAVVVDDYLMQISHAFRGEEWLPSAPVHVLLWQYLFGVDAMPQWAHLPLILKPDGNGKLSKRDGDRLGFPVFAMDWTNADGEVNSGFKEKGFLPEAFINMLAMLGWNAGTEQEIFALEELVQQFSMDRVHQGGAKFDYEKAKWYNGEWIKKYEVEGLRFKVRETLGDMTANFDDTLLDKIIALVKDRCILLTDFVQQAGYFFKTPTQIDVASIQPKWDEKKQLFFVELMKEYQTQIIWDAAELEKVFKETAAANQLKTGELMLPLRIMLVGGKFGPGLFDIASILSKEETVGRIKHVLQIL